MSGRGDQDAVVFRYNPFSRLPMLFGVSVIGLVGCAMAFVQFSPGSAHDRPLLLVLFAAPFALMALAGWSLWAVNVLSGPAARLTPVSAEFRAFGSRVLVDRTAPGLKLDRRPNGFLVSPSAAVTILRKGLLRARKLPGDLAWVPLEHTAVWRRGELMETLNGWGAKP